MSDTNWPTGDDDGGIPPVPPPPPAAPADVTPPGGRTRAEFGERAIAYLIDLAVIFVLFIAVVIVAAVVGFVSDALGLLIGLLGYLVVFVASIAILIMGEGGPLGQTPGKHMRGIQVIKKDGSAMTMGDGGMRYLGRIVDSIACGIPIGYLWPLFDAEQRAWHDIIASTTVVTDGPKGDIKSWVAGFRG